MQIRGELQDERDERFRASSLKTTANAPWTTDPSTTTSNNDIYNGRHGVRRDGQPRDMREDTKRHSRFVNEKPGGNKEDTREVIRRAQGPGNTQNPSRRGWRPGTQLPGILTGLRTSVAQQKNANKTTRALATPKTQAGRPGCVAY
jgi:hypothetical protein